MTMITPSYLGETIEYSSLHACRSTLEDPTDVQGFEVPVNIANQGAAHREGPPALTGVRRRGGIDCDVGARQPMNAINVIRIRRAGQGQAPRRGVPEARRKASA